LRFAFGFFIDLIWSIGSLRVLGLNFGRVEIYRLWEIIRDRIGCGFLLYGMGGPRIGVCLKIDSCIIFLALIGIFLSGERKFQIFEL
jgi:hypothetical protein